MEIISHRGYWLEPSEKNLEVAFHRSFKLGFGTETDLRDLDGEIVISHDMAKSGVMTFEECLDIYNSYSCQGSLALNIKADGLQTPVKDILKEKGIENYFLFDMSVPDLRVSINSGLKCFTRISDLEPTPSMLEKSLGIWVDSFEGKWITDSTLANLLEFKKPLCFVSPELHKRDPQELWPMLKQYKNRNDIILCTDLPAKAKTYFEA
ncbi:hypothetical protein B9G69_014780 [Bdellovibrio sp. SKB1291214]|uniref:phosphodiesterase n=1 Tax=Bdellovibrio sp. SKB1291214 TaxID=1732569 RepID=UPI000B51DFB9|nr:phosphodiesterase [Bdellovibrio sp. SKB1291214]UYL08304.1 hypothetical protein B9G69_014780 [Bdellovibrio sp. SKB1291214]